MFSFLPAVEHYGIPFDSLKKIYTYHSATIVWKGQIEDIGIVESTVELVPVGLVLNLLVYGSLSLVIVKVASNKKEYIMVGILINHLGWTAEPYQIKRNDFSELDLAGRNGYTEKHE